MTTKERNITLRNRARQFDGMAAKVTRLQEKVKHLEVMLHAARESLRVATKDVSNATELAMTARTVLDLAAFHPQQTADALAALRKLNELTR